MLYQNGQALMMSRTYEIQLGAYRRVVELVDVSTTMSIAYVDFLCDHEFIWVAARLLAERMERLKFGCFVAPATGAIPLCFALSTLLNKPYVILRKDSRAYMSGCISVSVRSVAASKREKLFVEERYIPVLREGPVVLLDTVASSGKTIKSMETLMKRVGVVVSAVAVVFLEGDILLEQNCIYLGRLPTFPSSHSHEALRETSSPELLRR